MKPQRGRPRASSRSVLADAACELFLEQGYEAASVSEIARRAGVSRASFFNYFSSKTEIVWFELDALVQRLEESLAADDPIPDALVAFGGCRATGSAASASASASEPQTLALTIVDARTMGIETELESGRAERTQRIAALVTARLRRAGTDSVHAEIIAGAYAAALIGAVWRWAEAGAGRPAFADCIADAVASAASLLRR